MNTNRIEDAIDTLNRGGIIIFPTDTAYGIGCRIDNEHAIEKLFTIRKRSRNKAVPILADSIEMVKKYIKKIDPSVLEFAQKYWPGELTVVFPCNKNKVPGLARGGGDTLGFRIPANNNIRALIRKVGVPILAPSANFSGESTPFLAKDIDPKLKALVDFVLIGDVGKNHLPSTVIDCSKVPWRILREGVVKPIINSLFIDTRDNNKIIAKLIYSGIKLEIHEKAATKQGQALLPLIEQILQKAKIKPKDIQQVYVEEGPGSFTGVRVGVAIANALSFGAQVEINGNSIGKFAQPKY